MMHFNRGVMKEYIPYIEKWDKPTERVFNGKTVVGRPTRAFGTSSFEYAGKLYEPDPWTKNMEWIKQGVEEYTKGATGQDIDFTFCLCGLYKNGNVGIPHHSDTVPTEDDIVVSISFGEPRLFTWQEYQSDIKPHCNTSEINIKEVKIKKYRTYLLRHGDVIIFDGASQMRTTHCVPKLKGVGERINLTFRSGI